MAKQILLHFSARFVFLAATAGLGIAFLELGLNFLGISMIGYMYAPGRLMELSATLLLYVISVLVWEVLGELKKRR